MTIRHKVTVGLLAVLLAGSGSGALAESAATQGTAAGAALPCNQFPTPAPLTGAPTPLRQRLPARTVRQRPA